MEKKVSISRARQILGSKYNTLTDDQVQEVLIHLELLAKDQLVYIGSKEEEYSNEHSNHTT